jgi:hypothetical protein
VDLANAVRYIINYPEGDPDEDAENFVMECKGSPADEENPPQYIIRFQSNFDKYKEEGQLEEKAAALQEGYSESNPDVKVVLVSSKALTGSKEKKLLYKMQLFKELYGSTESIDEAIKELGGDDDEGVYVYPRD